MSVSKQSDYLLSSELSLLQRWWQAANYLTIGQIYLQDNPLLTEPLQPKHIKPRLLGHWGTSPGLSILYVHLNRIIVNRSLSLLFLAGPGHGGPAVVANTYLEGTYSEVYPTISRDTDGIKRLFRQFSTPGGIPSHVSPPTPGSIHEGGELGYVLMHAFGAVFDNPDLIAVAVVGDGEAETGPLEGSWKGISFLNPIRDGAVLPVLHLNGYKIAGPTVLGRERDPNIEKILEGHGYQVYWVDGDESKQVHDDLARVLDLCFDSIKKIQSETRESNSVTERPRWPCIVLRTPKGWTGPKVVDGKPVEGTWRAHQVPLDTVKENPEHLKILEEWLKSYQPHEVFTPQGQLIDELQSLAPKGTLRMSANPAANAGQASKPLKMPNIADYALSFKQSGTERRCSTEQLGKLLRDIYRHNPNTFRLFCPDETNSNRLGAVFEVTDRCFVGKTIGKDVDGALSASGRVMEVLSEHNCEGWLEGYTLTGRHGLFASYEAFTLIVASMVSQHAKWLEVCDELPWRAPIPSLNILLTSTCWRNDHNGFSHQGPGFMDCVMSKQGKVARVYLPPDANCLLATAEHCFTSKNYINLIIIDKQPQLQYLTLDEAREHAKTGASIWKWASSEQQVGDSGEEPDLVMACCGDIPTQEMLAAVWWLRKKCPSLHIRVVNVIDALCLYVPTRHPHGLSPERFSALFGTRCEVVFAFHGYPGAIKMLIHGRGNTGRFHVRGYQENGTTTTPFDMVVLNEMSRLHLAMVALKSLTATRRETLQSHDIDVPQLMNELTDTLKRHERYTREYFDDLPEIKEWNWASTGSSDSTGATKAV